MPTISSGGPFRLLVAPYRHLGPSLWSMFFATMVNRFGDFVAPFLALYLSKSLGFDVGKTGVIVSVAFAASTLGSFISGRLADTMGRKQSLMAWQGAAALCNLALSFLFQLGWAPWLIVLGGLFRGAARPLIGAVLTDLAPSDRRKEVFSLQYWSINVGVAIGPLVAAFFFDHSLPWLFRGDALCTLISIALIARGVKMPASGSGHSSSLERKDERGALKAFLARPILLAFGLTAILHDITYAQTSFALPLTLTSALGDAGTSAFGLMMSLNAVVVIALSIPVARVLRAVPPLFCFALSGIFFGLGFALLAFPLGMAGYIVSTVIWTLGEISASTNLGVFIARHSPENWRGSFQSFVTMFFQAGLTLGPLVSGPILSAFGNSTLWLVQAALCAVWMSMAFIVGRWDGRIQSDSLFPSTKALEA